MLAVFSFLAHNELFALEIESFGEMLQGGCQHGGHACVVSLFSTVE